MLGDSAAFSGFSVNDPEAARRYYEEVLGLRTEGLDGEMFRLKLGGGRDVFVYPSPSHQPASLMSVIQETIETVGGPS